MITSLLIEGRICNVHLNDNCEILSANNIESKNLTIDFKILIMAEVLKELKYNHANI